MKTVILTLCKMFVVILISVISHVVIANTSIKKFQINVTKRPAECPIKSKIGDRLHAHYKGFLENGKEFDNSYAKEKILKFTLGRGEVIKGWDKGLEGMCVGEHRTLYIPSELAFGEAGAPPRIPKFTSLIFEVELVKIDSPKVKTEL